MLVDQKVEHSKLYQSAEAEDEADGNIEIQCCDIGHSGEILPGIGTQCGHGEYRGDPCKSTGVDVGSLIHIITLLKGSLRRQFHLTHLPKEVLAGAESFLIQKEIQEMIVVTEEGT